MHPHSVLFLFFFGFHFLCNGQNGYRTGAMHPDIKTLRISNESDPHQLPLLELGSGQQLEISFDELASDPDRIAYRIVHCDADWTPSRISEMEYLDGFNNNPVEEITPSFNTFTPYYHYSVTLPDDRVNFKLSGNYAVLFYKEDSPEEVIATACFSVYENGIRIRGDVTTNTDIDFNKAHQQLSLTLNWEKTPVSNPALDLKVKVTQNNRRDTEITLKTPSRLGAKEVVYEHNRNLIFEAGNNFRRFEIVSNKYRGMGVENIRYLAPLYHVTLSPDQQRSNRNYYYDQDQNGRYVIRQSEATDNDTEADYYMVHFALDYNNPLIEGTIYLNGDFTYGRFNDAARMIYNFDTQRYEQSLLLKQGHYNYQYLFVPINGSRGSAALIEGNYFETDNEYLIKAYYRPVGERYDRLIGIALIK